MGILEEEKSKQRRKNFILCNNLAISCLHERFLFIVGAGLKDFFSLLYVCSQYILDLRHTKPKEWEWKGNTLFLQYFISLFRNGVNIPKGLQEHQNVQQLFVFTLWITSIFCVLYKRLSNTCWFYLYFLSLKGIFPTNLFQIWENFRKSLFGLVMLIVKIDKHEKFS